MARRRRKAPETPDLFAPRPSAEPPGSDPEPNPTPPPTLEPVDERRQGRPSLYFDEPQREFEHNGGVHLTGSILWCDSERRRDLTFISHAHADHIGKNRRILATDKTVKILTRGTGKIDALTSPYRRA